MTADKIREVIDIYRKKLQDTGILKKQYPHSGIYPSHEDILSHCYYMIDEMESLLDEGRIEKAFRWLGFVQGCLFSCRVYTIYELKEHNRPS